VGVEGAARGTRRLDERIDGEIDVYPTGATVAHFPPTTTGTEVDGHHGAAVSELLRRSGVAVREGIEHARDFHARPGHRPGAAPTPSTTSSRQGGDTDIVRPVLVDPNRACELALSGRLFAEPIEHLDVDVAGDDRDERRYLVWDATIRTGRRHRHRATLHLLASPSMVVTVIELVPTRRVRRHRDRFVRDAVIAVEELARRLAAGSPAL
jgi:hypothetical protein